MAEEITDETKELREKYDTYLEEWKPIRDAGNKDMKYVAGDPWDPAERLNREANDRVCISTDELSQYINQLNNNVRQNKRSAKVTPLGSGANDKTGQQISSMIRGIEYESKAQQAYICAFENATSRSYGFWVIRKRYVDDRSFNQKLHVARIPNPNSVLMDPFIKEIDGSDQKGCFLTDRISHTEFKKKWKNAKLVDFNTEHQVYAPKWVDDKTVQVGEHWYVDEKPQTLIEFVTPHEIKHLYKSEITKQKLDIRENAVWFPDGKHYPITNDRDLMVKEVKQQFTNGLEILEENEWEGQFIPVIPVFGKELYVNKGSGDVRMLESLIRKAQDPYMLYCYYRTCEAEVVGQTPKTPFVGAVGQFKSDKASWENLHKIPRAFVQYDVVTDQNGTPLPPPSRPNYEPAIQALELGAEAMKRQIQSSIGMYNTSVGRSDTKASSGVAINALDRQSDEGTFHFINNFDFSLQHSYRCMLEMFDYVYDSPRDVPIVDREGKYSYFALTQDKAGNIVEHNGDHNVTIETGPSFDSQRDEVDAFIETLSNMPGMFQVVADLLVKAKNMGPLGDQIAERLTPPQFKQPQPMTPEAQQALQQMQQKLQAINAHAQQVEKRLAQLVQERQSKILDLQFRRAMTTMQEQTKLALGLLKAKIEEGKTLTDKEWNELELMHTSALTAATQASQQAHEFNMAQFEADNQPEPVQAS